MVYVSRASLQGRLPCNQIQVPPPPPPAPEQFDLTSVEPQTRKWSKPSVNQTQAIS